jgi:hypothetical protein
MSGLSVSLTFPITPLSADAVAKAIIAGDTSPLDEHFNDNCLTTTCRNNWLEFNVHLLVDGFNPIGLNYLSHSFKGEGHPVGGWYATVLDSKALSQAVIGIRSLISDFQRDITVTSKILDNAYISNDDIVLLTNSPSSLNDAVARYKSYSAANEGDDIPSLITFLQGHLSVLEFALSNSLSVVYAVYLY